MRKIFTWFVVTFFVAMPLLSSMIAEHTIGSALVAGFASGAIGALVANLTSTLLGWDDE